MKINFCKLLLLIIGCLFLAPAIRAEIKVIKLSYSNARSIMQTLNQLFGQSIKMAEAPSMNAVIINCDDANILQKIDELVKTLDRKPAVLRFSIKRAADANSRQTDISLGKKGRFRETRSVKNESNLNSVIAIEHRKARITDDSIRIFRYNTYFGEAIQTVTISHGLLVSGHLTDKNTVQLDIWFAAGEDFDSETLLTSVFAPLGHWVSIGGAAESNTQTSPVVKLGDNAKIGQNKSSGHIDRRYDIRVDLVGY
ncbi:MAG: hypothetical protein PWR01_4557 [Clostridiales bacterium]|nr:hypothetical protein [Clostridiales bacterium]MDN5283484.1 hypothetical protein [Candidatus Ozemobacter sp.]